MMIRVAVLLTMGTVLIAGLLGSAAKLDTKGGTLQDGSVSATCTNQPVTPSYAITFQDGAYQLTGVTLTGFAPECAGKTVKATFTQASGQPLAEASGTVDPGALTFTAQIIPVRAAAFRELHILVGDFRADR